MVDTTTAAANDCAAEAKLAALQQKSTQANSQAAAVNAQCQQNATFDSEVLEEIDDDEAIIATTVAPVNTPNSSSKAKYTWNSAWPRPLGEEKEEK
jgi:hypothetical protein